MVKGEKASFLDIARTMGYRCEILVGDNPEESRQKGMAGSQGKVGMLGMVREYVSAYNLVSHSRAEALGQVAIDGTGSHGKWPVLSPGPPDSLVEDRPLCWDWTSASQTLAVLADQPFHPSLSSSFVLAILSGEDNPTSEKSTCSANVNESRKPGERIIRLHARDYS